MKDLDRLMSIARRATPGPWEWEPPSDEQWPQNDESLVTSYIEENEDYPKLVLSGWGYDASGTHAEKEDREFIAEFNPEAVLALLDRVEKAERERDEYRDGTTIVKLTEAELALQRVREQHCKYSYYELEDSCPDTSESHREERHHESDEIGEFYCEDMPTGYVVCDDCRDVDGERMDWPCPTIKALEGDE